MFVTVATIDFIAAASVVGAVNGSSMGAVFLQMAVAATGCVASVGPARFKGPVAALQLVTVHA